MASFLDGLDWPGLIAVIVLGLCALVLAVLWLLMPLILLRTNSKLNKMIEEAEKTNQLLKQRSKKTNALRRTKATKKPLPQTQEKKEPVVKLGDM